MIAKVFRCSVAIALAACGPYASSPEPAPGPSQPDVPAAPADGTSPESPASTPESPPGPSSAPTTSPKLEIVLTGHPIQAFAIGDTHVLTLETDVQTRLVATEKAAPHAVNVLLEEDVIDGVRFESVGASRGRVFVADTYGALKSLKSDGTDVKDEYVPGSSTRILSAPQTLWLAELPQFLGDILQFHWFGAPPAQVTPTNALLNPTGSVGDVAVDDEALVYATRGASTTLRHWAPAATGARAGHRLLATLPEEAVAIGLDPSRAFVHLPVAKEIRAIDRTTGTSTTVLAAASFDTPPILRSNGTSLYMLTDTALRRCTIASCASTMTVLTSGLQYSRGLVVDGTYAWIVMTAKGKTGVIARVPR